jgi:hypothetical protein
LCSICLATTFVSLTVDDGISSACSISIVYDVDDDDGVRDAIVSSADLLPYLTSLVTKSPLPLLLKRDP